LLTVFFIQVFAFASIEGLLSRFLLLRFGLGTKGVSFVFVAVGVVLTVIQVAFISAATKRFGSAKLLTISLAVLAIGLAMLSASTTWALLTVSLLVVSVGAGFFGPSIGSLVTGQTDHTNRGSIIGIQQAVGALARMAGPALAGLLIDVRLGLPYLVGAVLVFAAVGIAAKSGRGAEATAAPVSAGVSH
jgi:MFS transporter, DHA1 family, tetracycline resistance protein